MASNYVPGVCNINPQEIKRRQQSGHIGVTITILLIMLLIATGATWYLRIIIIVPAFIAAIGYLQARNKFCVAYASSGQHHADSGDTVEITDKKSLTADSKKTRTMNLQASIIASVVTAIVCVLPA